MKKNLQKFAPNLQKVKSSVKILKESRERRKFIEKFVKPAESDPKITLENLKLNPVDKQINFKKTPNTDKPGPSGTLNFKEKLSRFKFIEAGEQTARGLTECDKKQGPPLVPVLNSISNKTKIHINNFVRTETLTITKDGSAEILTNGKPGKWKVPDQNVYK